jgi:hypothetical protein
MHEIMETSTLTGLVSTTSVLNGTRNERQATYTYTLSRPLLHQTETLRRFKEGCQDSTQQECLPEEQVRWSQEALSQGHQFGTPNVKRKGTLLQTCHDVHGERRLAVGAKFHQSVSSPHLMDPCWRHPQARSRRDHSSISLARERSYS